MTRVKVTFNADRLTKRFLGKLERWVNKTLDETKQLVDDKTPEDTKTLLWNNKLNPATVTWSTVKWSVSNNTPYVFFVEFGVWWKNYNYNKPKWSKFYSGVWARMFARTADEIRKRNLLLNNIRSA